METAQKQQDLIDLMLDLLDRYRPVIDVDDHGRVVAIQLTIPVNSTVKKVDDIIDEHYANVGS